MSEIITTGRARTIEILTTLAGVHRFKTATVGVFDDDFNCIGGNAVISTFGSHRVEAPWGGWVTAEAVPQTYSGLPGGKDFGILVKAFNGVALGTADNYTHYPGVVDFTGNFSGSARIAVDVEEVADVTFSTWNGWEAPQITDLVLYERMKIGGALYAQIACGGATATVSTTIGTASNIGDYIARTLTTGYANNISNVMSITLQYMQGTASLSSLSLSDSHDHASFSCSSSGVSVTLSPRTLTWCESDDPASGTADAYPGPQKAYSLAGVTRSPFGAYPASLGLDIDRASDDLSHDITASGGIFADAKAQDRHGGASGACTGGTAMSIGGVDTYADLRVSVRGGGVGDGDTVSLLANGDDKRDIRVMFRCFAPFVVGSYYQAGTTTVDPGTVVSYAGTPYTGVWSGVSNGTVQLVGGTVALIGTAAAGQVASFQRSFTNTGGAAFDGYRYLRPTLKANGSAVGGTITVTLGSKEWTKDRDGAALVLSGSVSPILDLCSPLNETASSDTTDTRWPLPTTDGSYWGVTAADLLEIEGVPCPGTVLVKPVDLLSTNFARVSVLGDFDNWQLEQTNTIGEVTTETFDRRFFLGITDGRQGVEISDCIKVVTYSSGGVSTAFYQHPLNTVVNALNGPGNPSLEPNKLFAGWVGTVTAGTTDGTTLATWLNANRPATWLHGGHALWQPGGTAWEYAGSLNAMGTANPVSGSAQFLADSIAWYPGCGDAVQVGTAGSASYGGTLLVRAAYVARGAIHGLILSTAGTPYSGATVTATDTTDAVSGGSAVTDSIGWYKTESPWTKGLHSINVSGTAPGASFPTVSLTAHTRHVNRVVLKPSTSDEWIGYDVSDAGRHVRVYVSGGAIIFGAATDFTATTWDDRTLGVNGHRPCVRFDKQRSAQRAYVAYESALGGPVLLGYTLDEGRSWNAVATLFSSGKMVRSCITRDGRKWFYVQDSGVIKGICLDGQDNVLIPEFTAVASGVDDDAIDCQEFKGAAGVWKMRLTYRSGGVIIDKTSVDGVVFT